MSSVINKFLIWYISDSLGDFLCKVTGMVLRGIFLLRKKEIDWFYEGGAATIYPDGMFQTLSLVVYWIVYCICVR